MGEVKRYTFKGAVGEYVYANDFNRVTAERDAALGREAALVACNSELRNQLGALAQNLKFAEEGYQSFAEECDALQQRLTAAQEQLADWRAWAARHK